MGLLPQLAPTWFPPTGLDGSSARALWLELMGVVQTLLGGAHVLREMAVPAAIRWLAVTPPPVAPVLPFELETSVAGFAPYFDEVPSAEAA